MRVDMRLAVVTSTDVRHDLVAAAQLTALIALLRYAASERLVATGSAQ